ncbi:MAG: hypothetical protein Ta2G_19200 [Termitinemataceae bacterium]|nr:MAG: hypothetical protein Ta2G_19200 [Termitinemataceae bacterium]
MKKKIFAEAFKYSIPVLLGYLAIGAAFGLMLVDSGYPWYLGLFMSIVMYAGSGQYAAVGIFASGAGLWEACLIQLVLNARHVAYGITLLKRFNKAKKYKPYLIFALTDETFALLSSINDDDKRFGENDNERHKFLFYVSALDHFYWIAGSMLGAVAGLLIPFNFDGVNFALTALFIVLMIEQIKRVKKAYPFIIAAVTAVISVLVLSPRVSLLCALAVSLLVVQLFSKPTSVQKEPHHA